MKSLGLYLHIPFCRSKCLYCDFCSFPRPSEETVQRYVEALKRDLTECAPSAREYTVDTVYFGGGTPTCLTGEVLASLLKCVKTHYRVTEDAEITVECNPATADLSKLQQLQAAGFNRLSVGVQSIHQKELCALGRMHTAEDAWRILSDARAANFQSISVDVMFGIPLQTETSWQETLAAVVGSGVSHVSAYGLIVEEGTPFARREANLALPDEEATRRMYLEGVSFLAAHGFAQYEISNFSLPGCRSRHNLRYWNGEEFLGFGPAAYSDFQGVRFGNSRDLGAYTDGRVSLESSEAPTETERMNEYVMLRMRLSEGVNADAFAERFGKDFEDLFGQGLSRFLPTGLVQRRGSSYFFSPEGMYVSNAILSEILEF